MSAIRKRPVIFAKVSIRCRRSAGDVGAGSTSPALTANSTPFCSSRSGPNNPAPAFADTQSSVLNSLQSIYGPPGGTGTLETSINNLTKAVQSLSTSSDSQSARLGVLQAAQSMALQLNTMTQGVQALRAQAENNINTAVGTANAALTQIAKLNSQIAGLNPTDPTAVTLADQRDQAVDQLSQLMDIRVSPTSNGALSVFTNSGLELVGNQAVTLSFNAQQTVNANSQWNANPALSNLGTITVNFPNGTKFDLLANNSIRSGSIAADIKLRDDTLVQAQAQLDQVAAGMSSLLSDKTSSLPPTVTAVGAPHPAPAGFNMDLSNLQDGNAVHISYTNATGVHQLSLVRVNDPTALPLNNPDPNNPVVGIDFSGGLAAGIANAVAVLNPLFGPALTFAGASPTLTALDDGGATTTVNSASVTTTMTTLQNGIPTPELPMFTDGATLYTGAMTGANSQSLGYAGRIQVNAGLLADPSLLIKIQPTTASGDTTRPDFILKQLTSTKTVFSPQSGFGTATAPFQSTLLGFSQQIAAAQGAAADSAKQVADGQDVALNTLQAKFTKTSGVNIDDEMAHLLSLQNAYAANARVMSTVKQMFDALMQV